MKDSLILGDCLHKLDSVEKNSIDLIYLDPPFFTQKSHKLSDRKGNGYHFDDTWISNKEYACFIHERVEKLHTKLKDTGSLFFHCDRNSSHIVRSILDNIFGEENFQSEIIWHFKRWSNSRKGLLPSHQNIYFYSKTNNFTFNKVYTDYSPTTNIDQIMQKRSRDERNKSVYATNEDGTILTHGDKKGVPLSDVWEIPYLNPKAKERVGYPTQKPILLLERIIALSSNEGDTVLDPFCGSGTTLVASMISNRHYIGIDSSQDAIDLSQERLLNPVRSKSALLEKGAESYKQHDKKIQDLLQGLEYTPVQRNKGIDGLLRNTVNGLPVFFRVQRDDENIVDTVSALRKATASKGECQKIIIQTHNPQLDPAFLDKDIIFLKSTALNINSKIQSLKIGYLPTQKKTFESSAV